MRGLGSQSAEEAHRNFCGFLSRVAGGTVAVEDWNRHTVIHYADRELEAARAELVRAAILRGQCSAQAIPQGLAALASTLLLQLSANPK